jgi:hypothetical protein
MLTFEDTVEEAVDDACRRLQGATGQGAGLLSGSSDLSHQGV